MLTLPLYWVNCNLIVNGRRYASFGLHSGLTARRRLQIALLRWHAQILLRELWYRTAAPNLMVRILHVRIGQSSQQRPAE